MISCPRWSPSRVSVFFVRGALLVGGTLAAASCSSGSVGSPTTVVGDQTTAVTSAAPATTDEPPVATSQSGDRTCVVVAELERCWLTYVPTSASSSAPLLLDFHGHSGSAEGQRSFSGFRELADDEGFVAVWPEGQGGSWNAGELCCPPASSDNIDDVAFTRKMVALMHDDANIDLDRVYVTGFSNGCAMAQRLAADASDLIAAVGCMSLYLLDEADPGYAPVPVMEIHGASDVVVAYDSAGAFTGARQNREHWAELNECVGEPEQTWESGASVAFAYLDCAGGTEVSLVSIDGGRHRLYAGSGTEIDTTRLAWDFMSRFENDPETK